MELFNLTGRVALVTGGNGGIGLGMARGLATAGAAVMIAGRDTAKNAEAVRALTELGAKASSLEVDLTRETDCRGMAR
jgi:2-dehydro-3-deoxy-D-gluconate 5-dehydrogenase